MTSLSSLILSTIHRRGPQSYMSLWGHINCESLKAVIIATATLEEVGFIECTPAHLKPQRFYHPIDLVTYFQLTQKGEQQFAAQEDAANQQEVCLGSK